MHVECWGTGVEFYVVTPFYIVSNLVKRKSGTITFTITITYTITYTIAYKSQV